LCAHTIARSEYLLTISDHLFLSMNSNVKPIRRSLFFFVFVVCSALQSALRGPTRGLTSYVGRLGPVPKFGRSLDGGCAPRQDAAENARKDVAPWLMLLG